MTSSVVAGTSVLTSSVGTSLPQCVVIGERRVGRCHHVRGRAVGVIRAGRSLRIRGGPAPARRWASSLLGDADGSCPAARTHADALLALEVLALGLQ